MPWRSRFKRQPLKVLFPCWCLCFPAVIVAPHEWINYLTHLPSGPVFRQRICKVFIDSTCPFFLSQQPKHDATFYGYISALTVCQLCSMTSHGNQDALALSCVHTVHPGRRSMTYMWRRKKNPCVLWWLCSVLMLKCVIVLLNTSHLS